MASNITTLVEKAKQGDADAFSTLYQMYYPKMKGICINILREDKAVVDDLVQDAFILAFVSLKDLKNTHRFSQWLTSITTNLVLKYQEQGKRYDFISLSDVEEEFSTVLEDDNTSKQSIPYEEIMSAIDSLPEGYKKIFNMSVLDGLSHQEISELLDIAPHSSSSQLSRAKAMLRNILSPRAMLIIVLALIVIPVYRYFTAKKKLVSENDVNVVRTRKPNEGITPIQKKPNVSVSRAQNAILCSNYRSVQQRKNTVITGGDSIKTGQNVIVEITDSLQKSQQFLVYNEQDSIITKDSIYTPIPNEERWIADDTRTHKKSKWQLLAAGSLGTTIAQNVYKIITSSGDDIISLVISQNMLVILQRIGYFDYDILTCLNRITTSYHRVLSLLNTSIIRAQNSVLRSNNRNIRLLLYRCNAFIGFSSSNYIYIIFRNEFLLCCKIPIYRDDYQRQYDDKHSSWGQYVSQHCLCP